MEFSKTLYKRDSKGKLRFLKISSFQGELIQESGLVGGKSVEHRSLCTAKNVGKVNQTTPEEQAVLEAEAKYTLKLKEGYSDNMAEAQTEVIILPTLAKDYKKESKKIDWENNRVFVQPKLDGMRCLKTKEVMLSRKNTPIETMGHIAELLNNFEATLDGELYAHGKNFQENMRIIKKERPESKEVVYHVYDLIAPAPFEYRYGVLKKLVEDLNNPAIQIVPTFEITSEAQMKEYHAQFLEEGYEGTMVRWSNEGYPINKRSSYLLKYKDFLDEAYQIVDILPSDKNPQQGVIICGIPNLDEEKVITFGCGMKFSHAEREEILTNKTDYIGKMAEVRFFEFSEDGIPRFPVCVGIRLDK